ncbi:MAG: hypothetical protein JJT82_03965 [Legionellaceae bacterium]|nr:hypothetical protein [Legionellaceae bacterium]
MNDKLRQFLESVLPFVVIGIAIAFIIALFSFFSYILLWGIVIGGVLGAIAWLINLFSAKKSTKSRSGRTIEHDDPK